MASQTIHPNSPTDRADIHDEQHSNQRGATTRQFMDKLGDDNIEHAALYSREAEQRLMPFAAMEKKLEMAPAEGWLTTLANLLKTH